VDALCALVGIMRRLRALILRSEVRVVGQCNVCGACCRDILLRHRGRWLRTERAFRRLCRSEPGHERFEITGRDETGCLVFRCTLQGPDNFCTCYENRLPLCKGYPSRSLYYQGGWLRPDCGYSFKALTFRDIVMRRRRRAVPEFSEVLRRERNKPGTGDSP
jgi:Fe-S-cluster containining protein